MTAITNQIRTVQRIEHPTLIDFNQEFGTTSDLSRYDKIRSNDRITSAETLYINQLQINTYIPHSDSPPSKE